MSSPISNQPPEQARTNVPRLAFIDVLRGLAVIFMIHWHTVDGWLADQLRTGLSWTIARSVGGMAAPMFVFLAGASLQLQTTLQSDRARYKKLAHQLVARGLEIITLGYLLRVQMWFIDGGAIKKWAAWPIALCCAAAMAIAWRGTKRLLAKQPNSIPIGTLMTFCGMAGYMTVAHFFAAPNVTNSLTRVDVLQCLGTCMLTIGALRYWLRLEPYPALLGLSGLVVLYITPTINQWVPGSLPPALAGYIGRWEAVPKQPVLAMFPLFPWLGYALLGVFVASLWQRAQQRGTLRWNLTVQAVIGLMATILLNEYWRHSHRLLGKFPQLTFVYRCLYRVGAMLFFAALGERFAAPPDSPARRAPIQAMGKASLWIYWLHMPLAFGFLSLPLKHKLPWAAWALGLPLLLFAMYGVAVWRTRKKS